MWRHTKKKKKTGFTAVLWFLPAIVKFSGCSLSPSFLLGFDFNNIMSKNLKHKNKEKSLTSAAWKQYVQPFSLLSLIVSSFGHYNYCLKSEGQMSTWPDYSVKHSVSAAAGWNWPAGPSESWLRRRPARTAWCPPRRPRRGTAQRSAAGGPAPRCEPGPLPWTCQTKAPAVPAATCRGKQREGYSRKERLGAFIPPPASQVPCIFQFSRYSGLF